MVYIKNFGINLDANPLLNNISKRYSGKSFKDSSVMKKPKLSLKEKRKLKKEKTKKAS